MYKCNDCGRSFAEPDAVVNDPGEGRLRGCPHCGSIYIVDLELLAEKAKEQRRMGRIKP